MKKILAIMTCCFALMCQAQEFKDYPLFADGAIEFGYVSDKNAYYIFYRDVSNFPDCLIEVEEEEDSWIEETYIFIDCSEKDFFEYFLWYVDAKTDKGNAFYEEDPRYCITEIKTKVEGGFNFRYQLKRKTDIQSILNQ